MNKTIKKNFLIAIITVLSCFAITNVSAQADSSFNYQGELNDNGSPANDTYDFQIQMVDGNGIDIGTVSEHIGVTVTNGLFDLDVKLGGIDYFDGYEDYYFEVSVRKNSVGGAYTALSPVQALQAVPLATNLVNGSATTGQVLTFNGFQWNPADPVSGSSSWTAVGSELSFMNNVGIGIANPTARLHVVTSTAEAAAIEGGQDMYVTFTEDGNERGYIGSFVSGAGVNDEDFEIGTYGSNSVGGLQFTIQNSPKMTIVNNGKVGINSLVPNADLNIKGTNDGDLFRIQQDTLTSFGNTAFYVDDNGGATVGSWSTPPANGLRVDGDVKQPVDSNGMIKYMVYATCVASGSSSIIRSYNGVANDAITVTNGTAVNVQCVIEFPTDIDNRFWQVSPVVDTKDRGAHCTLSGTDKLNCYRYTTSTGANNGGDIMVLVY